MRGFPAYWDLCKMPADFSLPLQKAEIHPDPDDTAVCIQTRQTENSSGKTHFSLGQSHLLCFFNLSIVRFAPPSFKPPPAPAPLLIPTRAPTSLREQTFFTLRMVHVAAFQHLANPHEHHQVSQRTRKPTGTTRSTESSENDTNK